MQYDFMKKTSQATQAIGSWKLAKFQAAQVLKYSRTAGKWGKHRNQSVSDWYWDCVYTNPNDTFCVADLD